MNGTSVAKTAREAAGIRGPSVRVWLLIVVMAGGSALRAQGAEAPSGMEGLSTGTSAIERYRLADKQYAEARALVSKEKLIQAEKLASLRARIQVVVSAIDDLEQRKAERLAKNEETREKLEELEKEDADLTEAADKLSAFIRPLETRTLALLPRLPLPLRDRVRVLSQGIPRDEEDLKNPRLTLGTRYQNVVGLLNGANDFNTKITRQNATVKLRNGRMSSVTTVYFGLGQAYFLSADGRHAGLGYPPPGRIEGEEPDWKWDQRDEMAPQVARLLGILDNDVPASYVPLPVKLVDLRKEDER